MILYHISVHRVQSFILEVRFGVIPVDIRQGDVDWVIDAFEDGFIQDPDAGKWIHHAPNLVLNFHFKLITCSRVYVVIIGDAEGYTPLIMAAHFGQVEIVDVLLDVSSPCVTHSFVLLFSLCYF